MDHRGLFRDDMDSFRQLIDELHPQMREKSKIEPANSFVDIISSYKSRSKFVPPSEDALRIHTELRTKLIDEKRKKINKTCNLNIIPPEVREQIFCLILKDYFADYPEYQVLEYHNWIMRPCKKINISGNSGLPLKDLPAFEVALIPDQKLYREFFALRIKQCTIEICPSVTWSHTYSFPSEFQVADPPEEITEWVTDSPSSSFKYMAWVYLQEKELGIHPNTGNKYHNLLLRGWVYQYPSLSKLSPIMLDNIRSVEVILNTNYLDTQYIDSAETWNKRCAHTFDVLSCDLNHAVNLASLSYSLNHNIWWFRSLSEEFGTLSTTTAFPITLRSLEHSLAVEPSRAL